MKKFDIKEFLANLNEGTITQEMFTQQVEIIGLIKPNEFNNSLLFAPKSCDNWYELNRDFIRGIRFIKNIDCGNNQYPLVSILIQPASISIDTLLKQQEAVSGQNNFSEEKQSSNWVAICTCGWRGFSFSDMMRAIQDGRQHESFYNNFPMG